MNFHHLSLTRKLTIAFSILVAIIIGVSTLSVVSLSESQRDFDSFVSDEFSRGGLARDVRAAASARAIAARNLIILHGPEDIQAETTAVKAAHDRVQERLGMLKKAVASTPGCLQKNARCSTKSTSSKPGTARLRSTSWPRPWPGKRMKPLRG